MENAYRGPWLRFSRGTKSGAPLIRYTTDGVKWQTMTEQESWDILTMMRGPDRAVAYHFGDSAKDRSTARIRGMFLNWEHAGTDQNVGDDPKLCARGYAKRPSGNVEAVSLNQNVGHHFLGHWQEARGILIKYFGGWPLP